MFDTSTATADLSKTQTGLAILEWAKNNDASVEDALERAYEGRLGSDAARLSASLPKYWIDTPSAPVVYPAYDARQAEETARREAITAAVIAAIKAGNACVRDTGTDSVSETTLFGGGKVIAVFKHYDARLGGLGFRKLDSPAVADAFIRAAVANSTGI